MHIVYAKLGQADAGDNEAKLMTKLAPEWVRTIDPVIRSPARYRWTTAPAVLVEEEEYQLQNINYKLQYMIFLVMHFQGSIYLGQKRSVRYNGDTSCWIYDFFGDVNFYIMAGYT